jgi:integrase
MREVARQKKQFMGRPGAKTNHLIIKVPIAEKPGALFPLLILSDGNPSLLVAAYARDLQRKNWSPEKVYGSVAAIGRLYDFYQIKLGGSALEPSQLRMMLQQFAEARLYGTIQPDGGTDPSGLNWQQVRINTVRKDIYYLNHFSGWVVNNVGGYELNPLETKYLSSVREAYETAIHMQTSLLAHLLPARSDRRRRPQFELRNNTGSHLRDIPKSFPPDKIIELIEAATNLRDKMAFILMAFGSLRISETMHIFLEDAVGSFRDTKAAYVALGHPVEGYYKWVDNRSRSRRGTRAEYLLEMFDRVPRNRMEGVKEYAGWKGMEFGDVKNRGFVHWIDEGAGIYFRRLVSEYFKEVFMDKPEGWPGHPYLFVKMDRANFGEPLTIPNLANQFYVACKKIGLSQRDPGVNPHGLRHFYGFYCADVLGIKLENLQKQMHHASPLSTNAYYHVSQLTIRDRLIEAQRTGGEPSKDMSEQRAQSTTFSKGSRSMAHDPFGLLEYFRKRTS